MTAPSLKQKIQEDENKLPYHYIDLLSEESRLVWEIERISLMAQLKKMLSPFRSQRILDTGCGDGRFCYELKDEKVDVVGVDISEKAIAFARVFNPGAEFKVVNLEKIPLELGLFDKIVCQEMLEHIPPAKINSVLNNLNRLLNTNGKIIFTVPSKKLRVPMKHFQHFDGSSLEAILRPYFIVGKIVGHNIVSYKRTLFLAGRYLAAILFPFRSKYKRVYKVCSFIKDYYENDLAIGKPENGLGLIAVCQKKL